MGDFFQDLLQESLESRCGIDGQDETHDRQNLSVRWLASYILGSCTLPHLPPSADENDALDSLTAQIYEEVQGVMAYVCIWHGTVALPKPDDKNVLDERMDAVKQMVLPWPGISEKPTAYNEDGKFAKAFVLEFITGEGDWLQSRF